MSKISRRACLENAIRTSRIVEEHQNGKMLENMVTTTLQHAGFAATTLVASIPDIEDSKQQMECLNHLHRLIRAIQTMTRTISQAEKVVEVLSPQYCALISSPSTSLPHEDLLWDYSFLSRPSDEDLENAATNRDILYNSFNLSMTQYLPVFLEETPPLYPQVGNGDMGLPADSTAMWEGIPGMPQVNNNLTPAFFGTWDTDGQTALSDEILLTGLVVGQEGEEYTF
jgi:hypothetical protein